MYVLLLQGCQWRWNVVEIPREGKSEAAVNDENEEDVNNEVEGKKSVWDTVTTGMAPFTAEIEVEDT